MSNDWPYSEEDHIEFGDSHLVPTRDGWFLDKQSGQSIDPDGRVYDRHGDLIFDPFDEEDPYGYDNDEYDFED